LTNTFSSEEASILWFILKKEVKLVPMITGVLNEFFGVVVHDCWGSYFNCENCFYVLCNAYLLREFLGVVEDVG